jgi:hexosaminidase
MKFSKLLYIIYGFVIIGLLILIAFLTRCKKPTPENKKYKQLLTNYNFEKYGTSDPKQITVKQSLWPMPNKFSKGSKLLSLPSTMHVICSKPKSSHIYEIANMACKMMFDQEMKFDSTSSSSFPVEITFTTEIGIPRQNIDESYTLNVTETGASITAPTSVGATYGLMTLVHLVEITSSERGVVRSIPNVPWNITDSPRFGHRGLMIDTARNFIPFHYLMQLLDALCMVKMNVLHWHVVDAQSFPLLLDDVPELAEKGAYSKEKMYNKSQVTQLVNAAAVRGIRVICEIDMPGHSTSWGASHPKIMLCKPSESGYNQAPWALEPPSGALDPNNENTYTLIEKILTNVVKYFPDEYIHVGGDEVSAECWGGKSDLDVAPLMQKFVSRVHGYVKTLGKKPMKWEETAVNYNIPAKGNNAEKPMPIDKKDTIINSWRMEPMTLLQNNYNIVDTPTKWYLDCGGGNWVTGGHSWCFPFKTWFNVYNHDPHQYVTEWDYSLGYAVPKNTAEIPTNYKNQVLGGTVCLWAEEVDFSNWFTKLFPRVSAVAERLWSPQDTAGGVSKYSNGTIISGFDMSKPGSPIFTVLNRLRWHRQRLVRYGIRANALQPEYCYNNSDYCDRYCFAAGVCPCASDQSKIYCPAYHKNGGVPGVKDSSGRMECHCLEKYPGQA